MRENKPEEKPGSREKCLKEQKGQRDCDGCRETNKRDLQGNSRVARIMEGLRMPGYAAVMQQSGSCTENELKYIFH